MLDADRMDVRRYGRHRGRAAGALLALVVAIVVGWMLDGVQPVEAAAARTVSLFGRRLPKTMTISTGTTIVWSNGDRVPHHLVALPPTDIDGKPLGDSFESPDIPERAATNTRPPPATYAHTFVAPGRYSIFCTLHSQMYGAVIVRGTRIELEPAPTTPTTVTHSSPSPTVARTSKPRATATADPTPTRTRTPTRTPTPMRTSTPVRTATRTPTPTRTVVPTTTTSPSLEITKQPGTVRRGANASVAIRTTPATLCSIVVRYKLGDSKATGLVPRYADATGTVRWTWTVGTTTTSGTWPVEITCGGRIMSTELTVE